MYFGLEVIQEYACGGADYVSCDAGPALVREFLHGGEGDQGGSLNERYPETVAMLTYMHELHGVPPGEPPLPPTPHFLQAYHYLHDVLGSVVGLVDEDGGLVERYTYDTYGKVFIETWDAAANGGSGAFVPAETYCGLGATACGKMPYSHTGNPFMWTGHRYDAAVGLYHTLFRFYDPTLGRWLQRDPIEYEGGSINLYEYALSSPLYWLDPWGLKITCDQDSRNPKGLNKDAIDALKKICPCNDYGVNEKTGEVYATSLGQTEKDYNDCVNQNKAGCSIVNKLLAEGDTIIRRTNDKKGQGHERGTIKWHPKSTINEVDQRGRPSGWAPPWVNLGHELMHAYDWIANQATFVQMDNNMIDGVKEIEIRAVRAENQIRDESNARTPKGKKRLQPRRTYTGVPVKKPTEPVF